MRRTFQSIGIILLLSHGAPAARGTDEVHELAPYIVKSTRMESVLMEVPQALSLLDPVSLHRGSQQITLDESLWAVPGVFILNPYNYAQDTRIAIRGFGARADFGIRGIQLLVDGVPATTPDGQGEVDGLDLGSAGSIEVLRGPSAVFYGAASGGAFLVQTEDPPEIPFLETRLSVGNDGYRHYQLKTGHQSHSVGHLLSGAYLESRGYRNHSETENFRLNGKAVWDFPGNRYLQVVFNAIDFPLQNDPGGLTLGVALANPRQARARNELYGSGESVRQGVQYQGATCQSSFVSLSFHYTRRDFANRLPFESGGQVSFLRNYYGARMQYRQERESGLLSMGLDMGLQDDHRKNFDNLEGERGPLVLDQDEEVFSAGAFAYYEHRLGPSWKITTALRHDVVRFDVSDRLLVNGDDSGQITFEETTPSLSFSWLPSPDLIVYGGLSRSFETPTTTEFDNPGGDGFNTGLDVQTARGAELGARWRLAGNRVQVFFDASLFTIKIDNALVPYELPQFPDREFYRNAGSSTRRGAELAMELDLPAGFSARASYTWSGFSYDRFLAGGNDFSGNRIPGIPRHFGDIEIEYQAGSGFFARWRTRFVGSLMADDANSERTSGYSLTDVRVGWRWIRGRLEVEPFLSINNLFEQTYFANIRINAFGGRYYEPAPGRFLHGGIRLRYDFN